MPLYQFLFMQGLVALLTRMEAAIEKLDTTATSPTRRRSSEASGKIRSVMRQSTLTKGSSTAKSLELPAGQRLQRLYTIDQDAFFPDLPMLVSVSLTGRNIYLCRNNYAAKPVFDIT